MWMPRIRMARCGFTRAWVFAPSSATRPTASRWTEQTAYQRAVSRPEPEGREAAAGRDRQGSRAVKTIQREWDWWAYHFRVLHRGQIPGISQWDDDLVEMIIQVLELEPGDRVLDLACGSGDHARRLARRGLRVLGIDVSPSLLAHCREKAASEGLTTVRFEEGDMRTLAYEGEFDAVLLLSGSFGFFGCGRWFKNS